MSLLAIDISRSANSAANDAEVTTVFTLYCMMILITGYYRVMKTMKRPLLKAGRKRFSETALN